MGEGALSLARLAIGKQAVVLEVRGAGGIRKRLLDLGLVPGTIVEPIRRSPAGDPTAFDIRGTVIALRQRDGDTVLVQLISSE